MKTTIINEIASFHQFFTDWYSGKSANNNENFAKLEIVLAPNFRLISPDGINNHRVPFLVNLKNAHGSRPELKIETKNIVLRFWEHDHVLAIYEVWEAKNKKSNGRICTAIFRQKENTPHGLEWVQVHETALPNLQEKK